MSLYVDIKKTLGKFSLNIRFEAENEILALLGASGCGKSMTLKCIAGIEKPDSGIIMLDGKVLFDSEKKINLPPQKRKTGYLFQNYALFPNMTVEENIASGINMPKTQKEKIIREKIKSFFLTGLEKHYPSQISGGQQQRVALARILVSEPNILMLDEPFSALDSYLRWQLEQEMANNLREYKGTVLFVSHNRDEVYRICDRIAVMSDGHMEIISEKWDLFEHPETLAASLLTGCKNISPIKRLSRHEAEALDWAIKLKTSNEITDDINYVGIRAHYFKPCENLNLENSFEFEIVREIQDTFSCIIMVKPKNLNTKNLIRIELDKEKRKKIGNNFIYLHINAQDVLLLK